MQILINEEWLLKFGFKKIVIDCDGFVGTDYELVDKDFNAKGQDSGPVQKKPEQPKEEAQQLSK